jgi:hypothetical protein
VIWGVQDFKDLFCRESLEQVEVGVIGESLDCLDLIETFRVNFKTSSVARPV